MTPSAAGAISSKALAQFEYRRSVPSIFLSHSHQDAEVAARLHARLVSEGIFSWLAEAELLPGDSLIARIQAAIAEVDYVAVLLSPASVASSWVNKEVQVALSEEIFNQRVKVVPILVEPCSIPPFLSDKLYADLSRDFEAGLGRLLQRMRSVNPGSDVRRSQAQRLLSLGYDRWSLAGQGEEQLLAAADLEEVLRHTELTPLVPRVLTYLVRSAARVLRSSPKIEVNPLSRRLASVSADDLRRELTPLFQHEQVDMKIGAARLLASVEGRAELLLDYIRHESDIVARNAFFVAYEEKNGLTPEIARSIVDSDESDWRIVGQALRHCPGAAGALVVSDRTQFASEIIDLVRAAGYRVVTLPGYLLVNDLPFAPAMLSLYSLLVLVRGEDYSREIAGPLHEPIARHVQHGGNVFATSWAAWEAERDPHREAISPVVLADSTFVEDETRTVRLPTGKELRVTGSFERLHLHPAAEALATFTDGTPFLSVRHVGAGTSVYLNICQHSCHRPTRSPIQHTPALAELINSTLRWLRQAPVERAVAPLWTQAPPD